MKNIWKEYKGGKSSKKSKTGKLNQYSTAYSKFVFQIQGHNLLLETLILECLRIQTLEKKYLPPPEGSEAEFWNQTHQCFCNNAYGHEHSVR